MFFVAKRSLILKISAIIAAFVLLTALTAGADAAQVFFGKPDRKIPVYCVATEEKVVALTFDAAWGADKTRGIITELERHNADATFFLVGFWISKYPDEVKYINERGFEIGNHSNNHLNMSQLSQSVIEKEITTVNSQIFDLTGKTPVYFRPPFGDYDNEVVETVESLDMVAVQWSVDSLDWKGLSGAEIADRVLKRVHNGAIILFHNNSDHILDALPIILAKLNSEGYKMVSLDELVLTSDYYVDSQGKQYAK